ncbi:MAG TPA: hypothetical protein VIK35_05535 [Verrucomicrobiae bacterium]
MKTIIRNPCLSWTIRVALILIGITLIAGFSFLQGMSYANKKVTFQMANDGCVESVWALKIVKDPKYSRLTVLFDRKMDISALKLAELSLKYPKEIKRTEYNALVGVRDFRKQYGRDSERMRYIDSDINYGEVDRQVTKAITYLESIHNTNDWTPFKFDFDSGKIKSEQ